MPLQESLTVNTSSSGLKTLSQQPAGVNSPPKVKVTNPSKKKPDKRAMNGNMAETAGAAGGIKAVQADVNANTLAPVTSRYVNPHYTDTSKSGAACTSVNYHTVRHTVVAKKKANSEKRFAIRKYKTCDPSF